MSDLFDKRSDAAKRRDARSQHEQDARKKSRRTAAIIIAVVAVVFATALIINSNFIRRELTAVSIGGIDFSAAEFDYFFNVARMDYYDFVFNESPEHASALLPAQNVPYASQIQNPFTGETWADFFTDRALRYMASRVQQYNAAQAAGFVMSAENIAQMDAYFAMLIQQGEQAVAEWPQFYRNPMARLREMYGSSLNEATLRSVLNFRFTAISYIEHMRESINYTDAQLEAFYNESRDEFDIFRFRILLVEPEAVDPLDFEAGQGDAFGDALDEAAEEAVRRAHELAASINSEDDFLAVAREIDEMLEDERFTRVDQQGRFIFPVFRDWLADDSRVYGDVVTIVEDGDAYVLFFLGRDDNNYNLASMRQILIRREHVNVWAFDGEDDPEFIETVEMAEDMARARAEEALESFIAGGANEARLIDMVADYSDEEGVEGGLHENIARFPFETDRVQLMQIVPELEEWLFDESRQPGDFELVRTEAFGYHLMFFPASQGELFRHFIASEMLREDDLTQWLEGLPEVETSRHWAFTLTQG